MIYKQSVETDFSLGALQDLFGRGYDLVVFKAEPGACPECLALDGDTRSLEDLLNSLAHGAPIFEWSHVSCQCLLAVSGPNLPNVLVSYTGGVEEF